MYIKKLLHPEYFQGQKKKDNYFEGWYYKFVSQDELTTLAFIPGLALNHDDKHAFIQVFISRTIDNAVDLKTYYFRYSINDFHYSHQKYEVAIGDNKFTDSFVSVKLENNEISLQGILYINNLTPIKSSILVPNIMGFFGYFNFMECYHGVISMSHTLKGIIKINLESVRFDNGKGYIEKDWGKSFPKAYVWIQSNHFSNPDTSLMFSYATIPFLGMSFKGLISNYVYQNKEYRFATYNATKILSKNIKKNLVEFSLKRGKYKLNIKAISNHQIDLASPRNGKMIEQIKEGLSGEIYISFYIKNHLVYEDCGRHAGIEIMMK